MEVKIDLGLKGCRRKQHRIGIRIRVLEYAS
jgi:hypothetical protein